MTKATFAACSEVAWLQGLLLWARLLGGPGPFHHPTTDFCQTEHSPAISSGTPLGKAARGNKLPTFTARIHSQVWPAGCALLCWVSGLMSQLLAGVHHPSTHLLNPGASPRPVPTPVIDRGHHHLPLGCGRARCLYGVEQVRWHLPLRTAAPGPPGTTTPL